MELGNGIDLDTGERRRRQKWITIQGTKQEAEKKLAELIDAMNKGTYVEPSKLTVAEWLDHWFKTAIAPNKRPRTIETYRSVLDHHLKPALGSIALQKLEAADIERYLAERKETLAASTLSQHSAILHSALKSAERKKKVLRNGQNLVDNKPKREERTRTDDDGHEEAHEEVLENCWEAEDARRFLAVARVAGLQPAAFYAMLMELGLRKGEICGLRWKDVSLDRAKVKIARQLVKVGNRTKSRAPLFGPPKNGQIRILDMPPEHRGWRSSSSTSATRPRSRWPTGRRITIRGWFSRRKTGAHVTNCIGDPIQANNIAQREFDPLIEKAEVRPDQVPRAPAHRGHAGSSKRSLDQDGSEEARTQAR
jgi:integrase